MLQDCLMGSFEDRSEITKADHEVIRELGHRFRGRGAWPLFRSYRPGYDPWYLTGSEARFLTVALEQSIDVALRFREDETLLTPERRGQYLVRVPEGSGEERRWRDTWQTPERPRRAAVVPPPVDESRLQAIRAKAKRVRAVWEVDFFWVPGRIRGAEGQPDWYPQAFLCVDQQVGVPLGMELLPPDEVVSRFAPSFLQVLERQEMLPVEVHVRRREAQTLLAPVAAPLGIRLKVVTRLHALDELRSSLAEYMGGGL
jgi:hypothetical protein